MRSIINRTVNKLWWSMHEDDRKFILAVIAASATLAGGIWLIR